jgi:choice-of-anchor B domain-containing protein
LRRFVFLLLLLLSSSVFAQSGSVNVPLLAHINPYPAMGYNECWGYTAPDGREYAFLGVRNGTSIIDITNTDNIYEIVFIPSAASTWKDIKTYQHYAYIVTESSGGMQVVDLSNLPQSAEVVATYQGFSTSHNIYIDEANGILYAEGSGTDPVRALSLSFPLEPVELSTFGVECHDIYARDNLAYVSEGNHGTFSIFNLENNSSPQLLQRFPIPAAGYVHNAWLSDDSNYLMTTEETQGKTIKMWDISDRNNIFMTDDYLGPDGLAHNTHIKGDYAYVSHYGDGLEIVDISDKYNLTRAGWYDTYPGSGGGFVGSWGAYPFFESGKILISDMSTGLYVVFFEGAVTSYQVSQVILNDQSGNERLEYGETAQPEIILHNATDATVSNAWLKIQSTSPFLNIETDSCYYGDIPPGALASPLTQLQISAALTAPQADVMLNAFLISSGDTVWQGNIPVTIDAPEFTLTLHEVTELNGDGDEQFDPGESGYLAVVITNTGNFDANGSWFRVESADPFVTVEGDCVLVGNWMPGISNTNGAIPWILTANPATPSGYLADILLKVYEERENTVVKKIIPFRVQVGQAQIYVWDADPTPITGQFVAQALLEKNFSVELVTGSGALKPDLSGYQAVFASLGIYSSNYVLSAAQGDILAAYLDQGGNLYMEGGDTWYYDSQTAVHPYFNIAGLSDGSSDVTGLMGVNGTFAAPFIFDYEGENSFIDQLSAQSPAYAILRNETPSYFTMIAHDAGNYRTIGSSIELGGLKNNGPVSSRVTTFLDSVISFFNVSSNATGNTPPVISPMPDISFEYGASAVMDLDAYVTDAESDTSAMIWYVYPAETGFAKTRGLKNPTDSLLVELDSLNHRVTFSGMPGYLTPENGLPLVFVAVDEGGLSGRDTLMVHITGEVSGITGTSLPTKFKLQGNYPNPFNPGTRIRFELPAAGEIKLLIYDALGREIRSEKKSFTAGSRSWYWDGNDTNGRAASSGIYLYRLIQAGTGQSATGKMILLR